MRYLSWQKLLLASSLLVWIFVLLAFLKRASERVDISKHPELLSKHIYFSKLPSEFHCLFDFSAEILDNFPVFYNSQ